MQGEETDETKEWPFDGLEAFSAFREAPQRMGTSEWFHVLKPFPKAEFFKIIASLDWLISPCFVHEEEDLKCWVDFPEATRRVDLTHACTWHWKKRSISPNCSGETNRSNPIIDRNFASIEFSSARDTSPM
mmetsp:Transcript_12360/g.18523  ORF Transcript_12360/g.18523 Transcript_12360/m.18523 type:complete len:131 (+) Transcript_12360:269-661(+)